MGYFFLITLQSNYLITIFEDLMRRLFNLIRVHKNWLGYLIHKFSGKLGKGFIFNTRSDLCISVPGRLMHTYKECFFDQTYFKGFSKNPIRSERPVSIDIGANAGYFSLSFFSKYPKATILAFEPIPKNFDLLKSYKEKFPELNFTIINEAVSGKDGELELFYDCSDSFSTSATLFNHTSQPDLLKVNATTLEKILIKWNLQYIDLLKIDCEGAEYDILYNASKNVLDCIGAIAIETHSGKNEYENAQSLAVFLQKNGFTTHTRRSIIWAERIKE